MKKPISKPIVYTGRINDVNFIMENEETYFDKKTQDIIRNFPAVYIQNWKNNDLYEVYVGETTDIFQRTRQHLKNMNSNHWQKNICSDSFFVYVVTHEHFNKSLALDIENKFITHLMGNKKIKKVYNSKSNPQNRYFPDEELDDIFYKSWKELRKLNGNLFPSLDEIKSSAIYKASPLHKLSDEQYVVKEKIINKVLEILSSNKSNQLIFVEGSPGAGKTVLNSSAFYDICTLKDTKEKINCYLVVNHEEQRKVYKEIAEKLGLESKNKNIIYKPTSFINQVLSKEKADVVFIDEAHLLLTQGKQSYRGKNQLQDIIENSIVTIVMFDKRQILKTEQYWEENLIEKYISYSKKNNAHFLLRNQMRMQAPKEVMQWIDDFTINLKLNNLVSDFKSYEIKVFDTPLELEKAIKAKFKQEKYKLSRMVATYDWEYNFNSKNLSNKSGLWEVKIDNWHKPWNNELLKNKKLKNKKYSWLEMNETIDEIGSTFSVQGFDLNYVGVILGPSIKMVNKEILIDPLFKKYRDMTKKRTVSNDKKITPAKN